MVWRWLTIRDNPSSSAAALPCQATTPALHSMLMLATTCQVPPPPPPAYNPSTAGYNYPVPSNPLNIGISVSNPGEHGLRPSHNVPVSVTPNIPAYGVSSTTLPNYGSPRTTTAPLISTSYAPPVICTSYAPAPAYNPAPAYEAPAVEYGVPLAQPISDYGVPSVPTYEPQEEYGVPLAPVADYGVPSAPAEDYGVPLVPTASPISPFVHTGRPVYSPKPTPYVPVVS